MKQKDFIKVARKKYPLHNFSCSRCQTKQKGIIMPYQEFLVLITPERHLWGIKDNTEDYCKECYLDYLKDKSIV